MAHNYFKWAEVDLDALKWNMEQVRTLVGEDVKVAAVVKANGYGHGSLEIMEHLIDSGADMIVVSSVNEAIEMRKKYKKAQTLVLGYTPDENVEEAIRYGVIQTVTSEAQAVKLSDTAGRIGMGVSCHIKIDTGMNRIGFKVNEEAADAVARISELPGIHINGIFSHFATADEADKTFMNLQYDRFCKMIDMLDERGVKPPIKHIANSAGIIDFPQSYMDMVRSGIITYGIYPSKEVDRSRISLKPAMSLKSRISHIKTMDEDAGISYGLTETVKSGSIIATVPVGYADGYPRSLSSKADVLIKGKRAKIKGRVCMDQLMVDISHIPEAKVGDEVVLIGRSKAEEVTVDELADIGNTISYELLCMIGRRVPRVYIKEGKEVFVTDYLE
ncbi:MAG: alanine racemase [Clostridiales bacterium]|nr:alanine racemase [Clostridiales bacterium]